jgi:hypothetical protein
VIVVGFTSDEEFAARERAEKAHREAAEARRYERPDWKVKDADRAAQAADADLDRLHRGR